MPTDPTDAVIAALADPGRRALLDALRHRDAQSVTELGDAVPHLGRHAVLKHLGVLEEAGLVTTWKSGRTRVCHLNAVPLVALAQRWLDDYGIHVGGALGALQQHLTPTPKEPDMTDHTHDPDVPLHRSSIIIDAPPERVWSALLDECDKWYFDTTFNVERKDGLPVVGAGYTYTYEDGRVAAEGTILAVEPNSLLDMTFSPVWDDKVKNEPGFRLAWRIETVEGTTMVSVEHYNLEADSHTADQVGGGSVYLISNLKTWIETGKPMSA